MADHSSKGLRRLKANNCIENRWFRYKVVSTEVVSILTQAVKLHQNFRSLQVKFAIEQEKPFG